MKNLKIEVPKGYEIDKEKSTFDNIVFKESNTKADKEKLFLELFQNLTMKSDIDRYPNSVFYFRGDELFLEIEKSYLWVSYKHIWTIFEREFSMNYTEIQSFIQSMVEKHFNWKGLTPENADMGFKYLVEKPFNSK